MALGASNSRLGGARTGTATRKLTPEQESANRVMTGGAQTAIGGMGVHATQDRGLGGNVIGSFIGSNVMSNGSGNEMEDFLGAAYTPTTQVDPARGDAFTQQGIDATKANEEYTKKAALNAMSNSMRAAGASSQINGLAAGGSSYLGNWRQATATGMMNMNDIMRGWNKDLSGQYSDAARNAYGVAGDNATLANSANQANSGRAGDVIDQQTGAAAGKAEADLKLYLDNVANTLKTYGIEGNKGATWARAQQLTQAVATAQDAAGRAAAQQALNNYLNLLAEARQRFNGDAALKRKYDRLEDYLKAIEREGYFDTNTGLGPPSGAGSSYLGAG